MKTKEKMAVIRVYVADCCYFCTDTPKIVEEIREQISDLTIEVIDIHKSKEGRIPDSIFSVPTYTLNGKTVSLGNPSEDFIEKLREMISKI